MIVWLASYPRSGNGFFRATCRKVFNVDTYSIYPEKSRYLNKRELRKKTKSKAPALIKTHELPHDKFPTIYIVRDGRDSLVSYAHWTLAEETGKVSIDPKSHEFQSRLRDIVSSNDNFGGWAAHVLAWHDRPDTHVVRFEDLISRPIVTVKQALDFTGIQYEIAPDAKPIKFEALHKRNPIIYRQGASGNWKSEMSPALQEIFWRKCGEAMDLLGYT